MFPTKEHLEFVEAYDALYDSKEIKAHSDPAYKRRDPREPGRTMKEAYEDKLQRLVMRYFNRQKEEIRKRLEMIYPTRKAQISMEQIITDELLSKFFLLFAGMASTALDISYDNSPIPFDVLDYSVDINKIAKDAVGNLISQINNTTLKNVQEAVSGFVDTPGMTIGELINSLPFNQVRSRMIAVSEVTNLYASVEIEIGNKLQQDWPDVVVVKEWFTNNDPDVCEICRSLDGLVVPVDAPFITDYGEFMKPGEPHPQDRCWISTRTVIDGA